MALSGLTPSHPKTRWPHSLTINAWDKTTFGSRPTASFPDTKHALLYGYFAVGIFSAMLMEYEVHFYSSGAMEEEWTPKDLGENFMVAAMGSILGSLLTIGLLALGAILFLPRH